MYAADELLTQHGVRVNVFEKLPTPYGLVRAGVAPDHQNTKRVTRLFERVAVIVTSGSTSTWRSAST